MTVRFIHTADIHLGKTYRNTVHERERYGDFFRMLSTIVAAAIDEKVDFFLIAGDLFHTGQILPRTFARTIEVLQPLRDAGIPCIAVEGNHDWIHRRDNISWMEALSHMGYIRLLRPGRTESGGYRFDIFDGESGSGGRTEIAGMNIYGVGYIGAQAGIHVPRICEAVTTENNILLFHAGIWTYSPVEIGNIKPEEALPLADAFRYVALGHGHKPYVTRTPEERPYAWNPGSPERVNFGEESYDKGYWFVTVADSGIAADFRPTAPRPMRSLTISLDGAESVDSGVAIVKERLQGLADLGPHALVELKVTGRVRFHPFELGRERLRLLLDEACAPLHAEIRNHLSLVTDAGADAGTARSLDDIERSVLRELIGAASAWKGREDEVVTLALAIRDQVLKGNGEGEELLALIR